MYRLLYFLVFLFSFLFSSFPAVSVGKTLDQNIDIGASFKDPINQVTLVWCDKKTHTVF